MRTLPKVIVFLVSALSGYCETIQEYLDSLPAVLQYRQAYYEIHNQIAPGHALPTTHAWPEKDRGFSYKQKLVNLLPLTNGIGAEIGPLNIPILSKSECCILYVDHLDMIGLQNKYPSITDLVSVDRPIINNSLKQTLLNDSPLDFVIASQVFEHVANPIQWLQEIADILYEGGLLALSLPDRRYTFDLYREETCAADIVAAFMEETIIPNIQCIYDHYSLVAPINMHWAIPNSFYPEDIINSRGLASPNKIHTNPLEFVYAAKNGQYLDAHCWVFTPTSFLLVMSQLAKEGFLPFKCRQFYPTNSKSHDRGNSSFVIVLEKATKNTNLEEIRRSFLEPLGPDSK